MYFKIPFEIKVSLKTQENSMTRKDQGGYKYIYIPPD